MSAKTTIEWTDRTWNPVRGCSLVSAGCTNCYAMKQAHRFSGPGQPYEGLTKPIPEDGRRGPVWTGKIKLVEDALTEPLHWKKPCRVFVNSMSDLFHDGVPDSFIDRVLAVIALCPHLTFQVLTKRSKRMREYLTKPIQGAWAGRVTRDGKPETDAPWRVQSVQTEMLNDAGSAALNRAADYLCDVLGYEEGSGFMPTWPLPNLHLYVSVENQATAEERIPDLLATFAGGSRERTPLAAVRGVSLEPMLGAVELGQWMGLECKHAGAEVEPDTNGLVCRECDEMAFLDHVILGGESGTGARPLHPDHARKVRDDCAAAGVPFFFKQWGTIRNAAAAENRMPGEMNLPTKGGRVLDGRTWDQMPGESTAGAK